MALATVNLIFDNDLVKKMDLIAKKNNFTEEDVFDEIKKYRNGQ